FFREHNLVLNVSAGAGLEMPFNTEFEGGGPGLRGFTYRQFRGDTMAAAQAEYVAPLFKVWKVDVRGALFYDTMLLWFREINGTLTPGGTYRVTPSGGSYRTFLPEVDAQGGVHAPTGGLGRGDWHNAVGVGVRLYLRNINLPIIGFDVGYGVEARGVQFSI